MNPFRFGSRISEVRSEDFANFLAGMPTIESRGQQQKRHRPLSQIQIFFIKTDCFILLTLTLWHMKMVLWIWLTILNNYLPPANHKGQMQKHKILVANQCVSIKLFLKSGRVWSFYLDRFQISLVVGFRKYITPVIYPHNCYSPNVMKIFEITKLYCW